MDEKQKVIYDEAIKCVSNIMMYLCLDKEFQEYWDKADEKEQAKRLDTITNLVYVQMVCV